MKLIQQLSVTAFLCMFGFCVTSLQAQPAFETLHAAAADSTTAQPIQVLIANGADITKRNKRGRSALHLAAKNPHAEVIKALLDAGGDPNVRDFKENTPLHYFASSMNTNMDVAKALIHAGADVNARNEHVSILHNLLLNPEGERVAALLIASGANPNARGVVNMTALHQAVQLNPKLAEVLIDAGADLDARDDFGRTPIFFAVGVSQVETLSMLIDAGADTSLLDANGRSLLEYVKTDEIEKMLR